MNVTNVQAAETAQNVSRTTQAAATAQTTASPAVQNYYFSPTLRIDPKSQKVVLEYLDSKTGAVTSQYPSEKALAAYQQPAIAAAPTTPASSGGTPSTTSTSAATGSVPTATAQTSTPASILA
jgi:hypothetical protein